MPPMIAIRRHATEITIPLLALLLLTALLLAIWAIPAGRDKTPAPMIVLTRLKISSGIVAPPVDDGGDEAVACVCSFSTPGDAVEETTMNDCFARYSFFCDGKCTTGGFLFLTDRATA